MTAEQEAAARVTAAKQRTNDALARFDNARVALSDALIEERRAEEERQLVIGDDLWRMSRNETRR